MPVWYRSTGISIIMYAHQPAGFASRENNICFCAVRHILNFENTDTKI